MTAERMRVDITPGAFEPPARIRALAGAAERDGMRTLRAGARLTEARRALVATHGDIPIVTLGLSLVLRAGACR
jgi:hypothetical protein